MREIRTSGSIMLELMTKIGKLWTTEEYGRITMADPENITCQLTGKLMSEEAKAREIEGLADLRDTLQFLANWMRRTKTL
jgi:hypothetical protein